MKITVKHFNVRSTNALDSWVEEQILSLQPVLQIDEADITLTHLPESSPRYHVNVHLVTPGPDVLAEACDHTLQAAFLKAMEFLRNKITHRATRRQKRQREHAPLLRAS